MTAGSDSFYGPEELAGLGLRGYGTEVRISRYSRIYGADRITVGSQVRIDDFSFIVGGVGITIGSHTHIAPHACLIGGGGIEIEDFAGVSSRAAIYSVTDDYSGESLTNPWIPQRFKPRFQCAPVTLRRHALVGTCSTLLPGVELGEGVAVGAHSLVGRSCKPWGVYFGVPARRVAERSKRLLDWEQQFLADYRARVAVGDE